MASVFKDLRAWETIAEETRDLPSPQDFSECLQILTFAASVLVSWAKKVGNGESLFLP